MKILQVHNWQRGGGGEGVIFEATTRILREQGHEVSVMERDSDSVRDLWGRIHAFTDGIYSRSVKKELSFSLAIDPPDVVDVHNLSPLLSPSVLIACRQLNIPVVLRCQSYRLICPTGFHFRKRAVCELCCSGREYWCVLKNCRGNIFESVGYALRSGVARYWGFFRDNVTYYVPPTEFVKSRLVNSGFPEESIIVVPNMISVPDLGDDVSGEGDYVAYAGRISPEKGIDILLDSARQTGLPIRLAGDYSPMPELAKTAPANAEFVGHLNRDKLAEFYQNARFSVVPSLWYEPFGMVVSEAMSYGLPVIASSTGGIPEIIENGITGFLVKPGNSEEMARKMKLLWEDRNLRQQMGEASRKKAIREYSEDVYYVRLMAAYKRAIKINKAN